MIIPIDTTVKNVAIEIDGNEYPVADKTPAILMKLREADEASKDKQPWELERAVVDVLLGKAAAKKIFGSGTINVDRLHAVYLGTVEAFTYNERTQNEKNLEKTRETVKRNLGDVKEIMELVNTINGANKIHKPQ